MYLRLIGDSFTEYVFKEIAAITDRALLDLNNVNYDKDKKQMTMSIRRYNVKSIKKFLGLPKSYTLDTTKRIQSVITIKNIIECRIQNNIDSKSFPEVTILFGLKVNNYKCFLCSVEEASGVTCYAIQLKLSKLDIEIRDVDTACEDVPPP